MPRHSKKPQLPKMPKKPPVLKAKRTSKSTTTTWFDLPSDLMVNILRRVVTVEKLWNVQKVCRDWRKICKDPSMWRVIYVDNYTFSDCRPYPWPAGLPIGDVDTRAIKMCENAVDRSQGQLVDITMVGFCDDELLEYIADRSPRLRRLEVAYPQFGNGSLSKALKKLPKLKELNIHCALSLQVDQTLGSYCPELTTLKLNHCSATICDEEIIAICENLRELRHLEIRMNYSLSNTGLQAILDGCPFLKVLDLRLCLFVDLEGEIGKRLQQIECVLHAEPLNIQPYADRENEHIMDMKTWRKVVCDGDIAAFC